MARSLGPPNATTLAQDIEQEIWVVLVAELRKRPRWNTDSTAYLHWVATVAKNKALEEARRHSRRKEILCAPDSFSGSVDGRDEARAHEWRDRFAKLIEKLPPADQELLTLLGLEGMTPAEVASLWRTSR
jgi:RNA polymerase sigma factor (sigma-70 family)